MSCPKVSILMAIYNNETSVDASVQSIVEQTLQDWELILWNDGSSDGSKEKLLRWQEKDKRIKVYESTNNAGLAESLNKALEKSAGKYIARMDGDDQSMPDRLARQIEFLENNQQYAIVGSGYIVFDECGEWGMRMGKITPQSRDFLWGSQFLHPSTVMRRDSLMAVGGYRVCRDTLRTEDYDLFMRMYAKGYRGYNINSALLRYYERRSPRKVSCSQRLSEAKIRYAGFKLLGLMPKGTIYILKPFLTGLLPAGIKRKLQERVWNNVKRKG